MPTISKATIYYPEYRDFGFFFFLVGKEMNSNVCGVHETEKEINKCADVFSSGFRLNEMFLYCLVMR